MLTKKNFLIQYYEKWLERLVAAEIDVEAYKDIDKDKIVLSEDVPSNLVIGRQPMTLLTKRDVRAGDILKESQERKEIAQRFCDAILKLIEKEEKKNLTS